MSKKRIYIRGTGIVNQTCGVSYVGYFRTQPDPYDWEPTHTIKNFPAPEGAGWVIAGFTEERVEYKEAYEQLKAKWPIVYQSPVRVNERTGRKFFFCIYDTKGKVK